MVCSKGKQWFPSFHVDNWMGDFLVIAGTLVLGDSGWRSVHPWCLSALRLMYVGWVEIESSWAASSWSNSQHDFEHFHANRASKHLTELISIDSNLYNWNGHPVEIILISRGMCRILTSFCHTSWKKNVFVWVLPISKLLRSNVFVRIGSSWRGSESISVISRGENVNVRGPQQTDQTVNGLQSSDFATVIKRTTSSNLTTITALITTSPVRSEGREALEEKWIFTCRNWEANVL